jgi:hypothetical protein
MRSSPRIVSIIAFVSLTSAAFAQTDSVAGYAAFCYSQLGIKATDLPPTLACSAGTLLTTFTDKMALSTLPPGDLSGSNHLKACDTPAWLRSGIAGKQCYDATYVQSLTIPGNKDFQGALLCRHKIRDSDKLTDFDDVAMILHNQKNGKTCWFQTIDGESQTFPGDHIASVDGTMVPRPDQDTNTDPTKLFWLQPSETAGIRCGRCHDDGPWMNSQWLYSQSMVFENNADNLYSTPVYAVPATASAPAMNIFGSWPATDFVTVAEEGLLNGDPTFNKMESDAQNSLKPCTDCHKLSAKVQWGTSTNHTYSAGLAVDPPSNGWFDFVTGMATPAQATTTTAMDYDHTRWMPPASDAFRPGAIAPSPTPEATYDKLYKKHFAALRTCMETPAASRMSPCATRKLAFNSAPAGVGASVSAVDTGTGNHYQAVAVPSAAAVPPQPVAIAPGTSLQLGWQADATFVACTTEATMPPGVLVSSSAGSIGTGSNWPLPESPPLVGPLSTPGIYDFSIYCDNTYTASLRFQISGQPPPMLELVTSAYGEAEATAIDSLSVQQLATTTDVLVNNPAELTWIGDNVQSDCTVTGPGVSETGDVGTTTVTVTGAVDLVYVFSCTGDDGLFHSVSSTLHPVSSGVCNTYDSALGKAGVPNRPGNIQLYWLDTSGSSAFPVTHYNIYKSASSTFYPFIEVAGAASDPFIAPPPTTYSPGQTIEFTDTSVVTEIPYYYRIAPAAADDTEFCSLPPASTVSATVPTGRQ